MKVSSQRGKPSTGLRAFTLIELLVVITIMMLMAGLAWPALTPLIMGNRMTANLLTLSGTLDQARQYAISKNTYVWVLMTTPVNTTTSFPKVAVISSLSGTDSLAWSTTPMNLSTNTDLTVVGKVTDLPNVWIEDTNTVTIPSKPSVTPTPSSTATVNITYYVGGQAVTFTRCVEFTPTGEARISSTLVPYIDLAMIPSHSASLTDSQNQAVLRLTGITGRAAIYRQ